MEDKKLRLGLYMVLNWFLSPARGNLERCSANLAGPEDGGGGSHPAGRTPNTIRACPLYQDRKVATGGMDTNSRDSGDVPVVAQHDPGLRKRELVTWNLKEGSGVPLLEQAQL